MIQLQGYPKYYDWGSIEALPRFLGEPPTDQPLAELWFGSHPLGSSTTPDGKRLVDLLTDDPDKNLGPSTRYAFGDSLPFMAKLLSPEMPLSLQVHPSKPQAQEGFLAENAFGVAIDAPQRTYRDWNHKPELLFAIEEFEALVGFSVRRQIRPLLEGLDSSLAGKLDRRLRLAAGRGLRPVVSWILDPESGPRSAEVNEFADACWNRLNSGLSPAPFLDATIKRLAESFPGDPGVVVAFLMNPVRLAPGDAVFLPPRTLHSYQRGLALEVLANSDNVIRAGLTNKHVDRDQLIEVADFEAHPPMLIAPEYPSSHTARYFAPVEDFMLTTVHLSEETTPLTGTGPRIIICLDGCLTLMSRQGEEELERGQCVFVTDWEGPVIGSGSGLLAQCSVP